MDINQSSLSRYKTNKPGITRSAVESKSVSENAKLKEASASSISNQKLPDLKEGQIVKGQIIDHRYNEVRVQLDPGKQVVTAKLAGDVPLSIGQNANFQVTEGSSDHLVLKYLPGESAASSDVTIAKALSASNLAKTDGNKAIVLELLNNRMPVDVQTLQTLVRLSHRNPEATPLTLVLLYKNNIPITKENIQQFEAYQTGTNRLIGDITAISKQLTDLLKEPGDVFQNASTNAQQAQPNAFSQAIQINAKLIEILYPTNSASLTTNELQSSSIGQFLSSEELSVLGKALEQAALVSSSLPAGAPSDLLQQVNAGTLSAEDALKLFTGMTSQADSGVANDIASQTNPATANDVASQMNQATANDMASQENPAMLNGMSSQSNSAAANVIAKLLHSLSSLPDQPDSVAGILSPAERTALLEAMESFTDNTDLRSQIENGTAGLKKTLTYIQNNLSDTEKEAAAKLLRSPEYSKLLEGAFLQKWTLTPEKIAKKAPVQELYENLQEDMDKISHLAKATFNSAEALQMNEPVKNLQENLKFMKDLNEVYTYLQLPVQLQGKQMHSDLYVFTNKKALKGKSDSLSVLLHLDMIHLGALNIHVQMNRSNIQAKFCAEENDAKELIAKNLPLLEEALKKKGYHLYAELVDSYEKPDFSKDFIERSSAEKSVKRYTFDIRT